MKSKPDILVVLAGLLGLGMILSSFSGVNAANSIYVEQSAEVIEKSLPQEAIDKTQIQKLSQFVTKPISDVELIVAEIQKGMKVQPHIAAKRVSL